MNDCFSFFVFLSFNQPIVKRCKKVFDYLRIRRQLQLYVFVFTCRICFYISLKSFRFTWQWISVNWIKISMCSTFTVAANNKYNNYWPLVFRLTNSGTTTTDVLLTCKWGGMQMASVGGHKKRPGWGWTATGSGKFSPKKHIGSLKNTWSFGQLAFIWRLESPLQGRVVTC